MDIGLAEIKAYSYTLASHRFLNARCNNNAQSRSLQRAVRSYRMIKANGRMQMKDLRGCARRPNRDQSPLITNTAPSSS